MVKKVSVQSSDLQLLGYGLCKIEKAKQIYLSKITYFWDALLCRLADRDLCFGGVYCLHNILPWSL